MHLGCCRYTKSDTSRIFIVLSNMSWYLAPHSYIYRRFCKIGMNSDFIMLLILNGVYINFLCFSFQPHTRCQSQPYHFQKIPQALKKQMPRRTPLPKESKPTPLSQTMMMAMKPMSRTPPC